MLVFVLNNHDKQLMPCKPRKARVLLKEKKAKVISKNPFTIKMLYGASNYKQKIEGAIVPSTSNIGIAVKINGKCIYSANIQIRNDITKKMKKRSKYRRTRRNRKTRYRECRILNRKNRKNTTPTSRSKIESHFREIKKINKILPNIHWITVSNTIKINFKGCKKEEWLNLQRQTFERDNFKCRHCKGNSNNSKLQAHHIIHRQDGGLDELKNLVTLCQRCHVRYHAGKLVLKIGKHKYKRKVNQELHIIKKYFKFKDLRKVYGFVVKYRRIKLKLKPTPINNACSVLNIYPRNSFNIKNKSKGEYQQTKDCKRSFKYKYKKRRQK